MNGPIVLSGGGLWIEFTWTGDRWGHRMGIDTLLPSGQGGRRPDEGAARRLTILESIEGTQDDDWPTSPALQELHLEPRGDGKQVALLVGMAGTSHWSMSVELNPVLGEAVFDVACRVKSRPLRLGTLYRASPAGSDIVVERFATAGQATRIDRGPGELSITPTDAGMKLPRTECWRYSVSLCHRNPSLL